MTPALLAAALFAAPAAMAADDADAAARARALATGLRCVVCQNQSLVDSDADLARDMRAIIRERIDAGDSDAEVRDYLVERYGEFILLRPPLRPSTWILWAGPAVFLGLALLLAATRLRRRGRGP